MASVFTKIINGELPAYKIHEDELTISILALDQVNLGHVIVIPKREVNHWMDVPEQDFLQVQKNSQRIGLAIRAATGCTRVATITMGFEVPHYHLHLIPAWSMAEVSFALAKKRTPEDMKKIQNEILKHL